KVQKPGGIVRVKDIYDVSKILSAHPLDDTSFWNDAGEEFKLACASRFIDCSGLETFSEDLAVTRATYEADPTLPKDIDFDAAWRNLQAIISFWESRNILPVANPLPEHQ